MIVLLSGVLSRIYVVLYELLFSVEWCGFRNQRHHFLAGYRAGAGQLPWRVGLITLSFYDDPIRIIIAISAILVNDNSLTTRVNRGCRPTDQSLTAVLVRMVVTEDNVERFVVLQIRIYLATKFRGLQ
jgi:hypothetical protein